MPSNQAAWIEAVNAKPFAVKEAPYTKPQEGQLVIKNAAVAVNPVDSSLQNVGQYFPMVARYPTIFGLDVAGTVEEVGPGVKAFKKGDRVIAATGVLVLPDAGHVAGGYQLYSVTSALLTNHLPDNISFEQGAILPVCWITAATALFNTNTLSLNTHKDKVQHQHGKIVLIWGGSSNVGINAIQLLRLAGYEVITTASAKNHTLLKSLGATIVIDHGSSTAKQQILDALKGKTLVGTLDCIALEGDNGTTASCVQIVHEHGEKAVKKVITVLPGREKIGKDGVEVICILGTQDIETSAAGKLWKEFLPEGLKNKSFVPKPDVEVVGHGLGDIQKAVDLIGKGVSAKKLVVTL